MEHELNKPSYPTVSCDIFWENVFFVLIFDFSKNTGKKNILSCMVTQTVQIDTVALHSQLSYI